MSKTPRIPPVMGQPANLLSILKHTPDTTEKFFDLYSEFWQTGMVPVVIKEITRLRNARVTDCGY